MGKRKLDGEIDFIVRDVWGGDYIRAMQELGVSRQAISNWRLFGIPKMRRYQLDAVSKNTQPATVPAETPPTVAVTGP